jgi:hypothetical protein
MQRERLISTSLRSIEVALLCGPTSHAESQRRVGHYIDHEAH